MLTTLATDKTLGSFLYHSFYNLRHLTDWLVQVVDIITEVKTVEDIEHFVASTPNFGLGIFEFKGQGTVATLVTPAVTNSSTYSYRFV